MPRSLSPRQDRHRDDRDDRDPRYGRDDRDRDRYSSSRRDRSRSPDPKGKGREDDRDRERWSRRDRDRDRDRDEDISRDKKRDRSRSRSRDRSERKRDKKDKKRDKSPSRAARKEAKAAARREREAEDARAVAELSMYTASDNPFNDANLGVQFKWVKKSEKEKKAGLTTEEAERKDALRRIEAKEELERLNKKRADREVEAALREEEEARMARLAESAMMENWVNKEDDFHLEQARRRAGIRMKENRAKAIDFLAINLRFAKPWEEDDKNDRDGDGGWGWAEAGLEMDLEEPYRIFENLTLADTEELYDDIELYLSLEKAPAHVDFWQAMKIVCTARLRDLRGEHKTEPIVETEITKLLSGKTLVQLEQLEASVQAKLASGEPVDTDYWEGLLNSLNVWKARAKLQAMHEIVLQNRLEQLRLRQREDALKVQSDVAALVSSSNRAATAAQELGDEMDEMAEDEEHESELAEAWNEDMEPQLVKQSTLTYQDKQVEVVESHVQRAQVFAMRRQITSTQFVAKVARPQVDESANIGASTADLQAEALYRAEAEKQLEDDEEIFNIEEGLGNVQSHTWEDKYRARKPRYFNRVHTGFEWNKYNQTHYDSDNPPPKVVQGYKFNIFYPDLINPQEAPTYRIVKDKDEPEIATIIFKAGPPYEDIAFKIVNREWEHSHKRGFRSSFDRGVLQLYFNFRRNFYRK